MPETGADRALEGVRILDLSRVLAGPWATQLLADLGAEVIKVERPEGGDDTRAWGPPWFEGSDGRREAAYFACANRGKMSVTIDITSDEGADLVREMACQSDVLVENFKVGGLAKYGLDYDSLAELNPALVYCSVTGFGQTGPYASEPGYDFIIQAMGGLMSITGDPGGEPMKVGVALVDILTGLYASSGILAALHQRSRTGLGQHIDVALLDVLVASLANQVANAQATGRNPRRLGNAHPNIVPYQTFTAADGEIAIAVGNDAQFRQLCDVIGKPQWGADRRFRTNADRVENRDLLIPMLAKELKGGGVEEWLLLLRAASIPAGPVNSIIDALNDPQIVARGTVVSMKGGAVGALPGIRCPLRLSRSATLSDLPPPALGQDNDHVFGPMRGPRR